MKEEKQLTIRMKLVVDAAPRSFIVVSGGPQIKEEAEKTLAKTTRIVMNAGAEGRIIGRNFWGSSNKQKIEVRENCSGNYETI
ncbi:MAG: hypothetical protein NWE84_06870 [Candidatus Bathyarchaeota archaeon]|nr:hypothetical protein [Candidatus Bathyarchaeota archaeon]